MEDTGHALKYCRNHYCAYEHGCEEQRWQTSNSCERHTCRSDACNRRISDKRAAIFCSDGTDNDPAHECATAQCTRERFTLNNSKHCVYHICRDYMPSENCGNEGAPQRGGYCESHERCVNSGCNNLRFVNGMGQRQVRCEDREDPTPSDRMQ